MRKDYIACGLSIESSNDKGGIAGYGSVFGVKDSYSHVINQGSFTKSLSTRKPIMLWQHQQDKPIGVFDNVYEDTKGLVFEGRILVETALGKDAHILAKEGALSGMSIGGYIGDDHSYDSKTDILTINEFDLYEISLVTFPANEQAGITVVKSINDVIDSIKDIKSAEAYLINAGFSRKEAKTFISKFKDVLHRDDVKENGDLIAAIKSRSELISRLS